MRNDLMRLIDELGLAEHSAHLREIARPSIQIVTTEGASARCGSKLGGAPDVPGDFEWPRHPHGLYRFIGQVNLADIPDGPHELPRGGLISFFYAHDEEGESFWQDPDYVRVYRFDRLDALHPVEPPEIVSLGSSQPIRLELGTDVPPWPSTDSAEALWPIAKSQRSAYWDLRVRLHPGIGYLLGYPFNTTLGYDPTPGPDWQSLLTLGSDDALAWCWHDGDWLVTFIERQRLHAGDFSKIASDAG
ncbi:MAG: DUF1963 domain-containing protein [Polyangiaceae bacterium]|nr:DUF1963 domain-containing protein [Polyangiaceae bacterium]